MRVEDRHQGATGALERLTRRVSAEIGDGCVAWSSDHLDGRLHAVAAEHRDPDQRADLRALVEGQALEPWQGAWIRQVIDRGAVALLDRERVEDFVEAGLPAEGRFEQVAVLPAGSSAALVVVRDRLTAPFSARARIEIERLVGEAIGARSPRRFAPAGDEARFLEVGAPATWVTDLDHLVTYANPACCELVGLPAQRLRGVPMSEFIGHPPTPPRPEFLGERPHEAPLLREDGQTAWVSLSARPLFDREGRVEGAVWTCFDVTARRAVEIRTRTRLDMGIELFHLAESMLTVATPDAVYRRAVRAISDEFGSTLVALARISRDLSEATILAQAGFPAGPSRADAGPYAVPAQSATRAAVEGIQTVHVTDFGDRQGYRPGPLALAIGAHSVTCVPVGAGAACLGVLRATDQPVDLDEVRFIEAVGRLLSAAWPAPLTGC